MNRPLKVLVVDDSALMRRSIEEMLVDIGKCEVVAARNGRHALEEIARWEPDVVTLDVNMPEMDGLTCLAEIMRRFPRPVVMVSSLTERGAMATLEALALGAVDFVTKPSGTVSLDLDKVANELVAKVIRAASAKAKVRRAAGLPPGGDTAPVRLATAVRPVGETAVGKARQLETRRLNSGPGGGVSLVLIGASTGGPPLLGDILERLPADFPAPIVIAQHMPAGFTGALARRLAGSCALGVQEVTTQIKLEPGNVYIGRGDADIVVNAAGSHLSARSVPSSPNYHWHPSVDRLVATARSATEPERIVGVLLTGMGDDGAAQMKSLASDGGRTIAESEDSAVVWGMPGELVRQGGATVVLPGELVAGQIMDWAGGPSVSRAVAKAAVSHGPAGRAGGIGLGGRRGTQAP